jgi:DNA polymerase/3'-5' exonuclease PolX
MSAGPRIDCKTAWLAALDVGRATYGAVDRFEVCGSLRRNAREVGDVEIVVVPRLEQRPTGDLFGTTEQVSLLELRAAELLAAGDLVAAHPSDPKNGPKYKKLWHKRAGIQIDLFIVRPEQWGPAVAIRTGPASFSALLVTELRRRGMRCEGLEVKRGAEVVPCPDERTFFKLCGKPFFPPESRV